MIFGTLYNHKLRVIFRGCSKTSSRIQSIVTIELESYLYIQRYCVSMSFDSFKKSHRRRKLNNVYSLPTQKPLTRKFNFSSHD
mmetsp:Transcript_11124/g.23530  ORF Transcript_11124/g.23530 Transcript_11124/m.23530 type:complete len:83 (-) Transcript_11124:801-1049(-)